VTSTVAIVDMRADNAPEAFVRTLQRTGFAVLRHTPLDLDRLARMDGGWRDFFLTGNKVPFVAIENPVSGNATGYIPPQKSETAVGHNIKDLKEFYHIAPGTALPSELEEDAMGYLEEALALGRQLLGWVDTYLKSALPAELRGRLGESLSREHSLLRILHYPPLDGSEPPGAVRAAAHEDINMLTVLPVSAEPGLQILTRDGQWSDVPGKVGDVVINAGDMLQEATGQQLPSTTHRVVNPSDASANVSRVAMPYFLAPELGLPLSERYTAGSYLRERLELLAR
jgi:isopenicillin N synthase-like dioxygenase